MADTSKIDPAAVRFETEPSNTRLTPSTPKFESDPTDNRLGNRKSIRQLVTFGDDKFDVKTLPIDMQRVVGHLTKEFGEDYALTFAFMVRTASELHRAWHMTLLTSKILQQIKDKFKIRTTWELGVIKLKFRVEDGGWELHRKVPYDYDSEFQDMYAKIAIALVDGNITIHQALKFQQEVKHGHHTAKSGLFLRDYPGRLILYPLEAATCAVIFFGGDWFDAGVAAVTGITAGLVEWALVSLNNNAKILVDVLVGIATGAIGGLFYRYLGETTCLPAVFLGTLYWFFYGTAFVIGILEIVAGELETGVIRFMAVSVKTFVLSLGSAWGLQLVSENAFDAWTSGNCHGGSFVADRWWRIPLYLLCSASALGQYRFPIAHYWRGLAIQLVGYEVQYQLFAFFEKFHAKDLLDTASANALGAVVSVLAACLLSWIVDNLSFYYNATTLMRIDESDLSCFGKFMCNMVAFYVKFTNMLGLGRKDEERFLEMQPKLRQMSNELLDPNHTRSEIKLTPGEEKILRQAIVAAEPLNVWALLMPTVYQLVPGSLIAKMWYNAIFPPQLVPIVRDVTDSSSTATGFTYVSYEPDADSEAVFSALMVIATSLALGLLLGMGIQNAFATFWDKVICCYCNSKNINLTESMRRRAQFKRLRGARQGIMNTPTDEDPDSEIFMPDENDDSSKNEEIVGNASNDDEEKQEEVEVVTC